MHDPHLVWWQCVVVCLIMHWHLTSHMLPSLSAVVVCVTVWIGWNQWTLRPCSKVFYHIPLLDWLRESIHICINSHPIKEGKVFLYLPNRSCRTLWGLLQWTWQRSRTSFRALDGLLLVFALPFFLWHGNEGNQTAQFDLKTIIWMQNMYRRSLLCDI